MSIFGKIMSGIFGTKADAATPAGTTAPGELHDRSIGSRLGCGER